MDPASVQTIDVEEARKPAASDPQTEAEAEADNALELLNGQRWATIGSLGNVLPLGLGPDRSFTFKPQNLRGALDLARHVPSEARGKPYSLLGYQLAAALESLQGKRYTSLDDAALAVRRLPLYSVLHMLCRLAVRNGRGDVQPSVRCPASGCRELQVVRIPVETVQVRDWGQREELPQVDLTLTHRFEWPAGQPVTVVTVEPAPFDALCELSAGAANSAAEITAAVLARAVVGVSTVPGRINVPAVALESLAEGDYLDLDLEHDLVSGGPVMLGEAACRRCGEEMIVPLPWNQLAFFEAPSGGGRRSRRQQRR